MRIAATSVVLSIVCLLLVTCSERGQTFYEVDSLITAAIKDSTFPGAVLMVGEADKTLYHKAYGAHDYTDTATKTQQDDIFDLASLTKVIATTLAIMRLYEEDRITLSDPVSEYIPQFGQNGKEAITIKNLLLHNAGFPPGKPFYRTCHDKTEVLDSLYAMSLRYPPNTKIIYSDIGFIVLGRLVEIVSDITLNAYVKQELYDPLELQVITFNPSLELWKRITPAEPEFNYRITHSIGSPKNKITQTMGGVAGHAGLFSNANDLSIIARMLLNGGEYIEKRYFEESTIILFTSPHLNTSSRGLGWDTGGGSGKCYIGDLFSEQSFGHTGFTGTSIWIDREMDLFIIFLTNRTYQMKDRQRMYDFRPVLHDMIITNITKIK